MSIKTSLLFVALAAAPAFIFVVPAQAAFVDCLMNYPDGTPVGNDALEVFYPNGRPLRTVDGEILYPNGEKLASADGMMTYSDGKTLKNPDGSMLYYNGATLRTQDGQTFNSDGSKNPLVRYELPYDESTSLIVRSWVRGSRYKLRTKAKDQDLVVNIDDQLNIQCQFLKPIGPGTKPDQKN